MAEEIWKDIEGYEGLYQISSLGRVKSIDRVVLHKNGKKEFYKDKIRKGVSNHRGYLLVNLSKNNSQKMHQIHRLVAKAFIPNPDNLPQVNHKDEDKTNNMVWVNEDGSIDYDKSNLEWCDEKYNSNYGTRNNKIGHKLRNHPSLSKPVIGLKNGEIVYYFNSTSEAERYGFNHGRISDCCNKKPRYKTHMGYEWMWVEDYLADWWDMEMEKAA